MTSLSLHTHIFHCFPHHNKCITVFLPHYPSLPSFCFTGPAVRSFLTVLSKAITAQPARAWQSNQQFFCHMETALSVCAQKFGMLIFFIAVVFTVHIATTLSLATSHFVTSRLTPLLPKLTSLLLVLTPLLFTLTSPYSTGSLNLIHLAERASYRLLDLYRDAGKIEKMAQEHTRAASAFREISDLASTQFALGTFYSVLYLGLGE